MMAPSTTASTNPSTAFPSVADFCKQVSSSRPWISGNGDENDDDDNDHGPPRLCIGNPAGDADSIVSAIGMAYVDTILRRRPTIPIVSIPLRDLQTLRPETKYLFSLAGMNFHQLDDRSTFIAIDDPSGLPEDALVTLVDHNQLTLSDKTQWVVEAILDHHVDEGSHLDTCQGDHRMVAFDESSAVALVASTCTLVVEQWTKYLGSSDRIELPPTLSILLLGVILLDSINLSTDAGKVTNRDRTAVEILEHNTDWSILGLPGEVCMDGKEGGQPDLTKLFETLQNQKFQPEFWNGLSAKQALQLDYKSFSAASRAFGISSILQSMPEFLQRPGICNILVDTYFPDLAFFVIMFMSAENGTPKRQLMLASPDRSTVDALLQFIDRQDSLQVENIQEHQDEETHLYTVTMEQGNSKASRKQVAPIFLDFLRQCQTVESMK